MPMTQGVLTILGCSGSAGVPRIGNDWGQCDPLEPRNTRTRASVLVQKGEEAVVVDTGVEFRQQMNREACGEVNAVFYTHMHSDHVNGIDDLRPIRNKTRKRIPVYGTADMIDYLQARFDYMFLDDLPYYPSALEARVWTQDDMCRDLSLGGIEYRVFPQDHQKLISLGFRFGDVAYSTDMIDLEDTSIQALKGIKVWVADGNNLYDGDQGPHANLERLQALKQKIGVDLVYVTHMKNNLDYRTLVRDLPAGFRPAFDGLKIALDGTVLNDEG